MIKLCLDKKKLEYHLSISLIPIKIVHLQVKYLRPISLVSNIWNGYLGKVASDYKELGIHGFCATRPKSIGNSQMYYTWIPLLAFHRIWIRQQGFGVSDEPGLSRTGGSSWRKIRTRVLVDWVDTNPAMETRESKEFSAIGDPNWGSEWEGAKERWGWVQWWRGLVMVFCFVRVLGEEVLLVCWDSLWQSEDTNGKWFIYCGYWNANANGRGSVV